MKSTTPELMKFKRLQRRLGESTRGVVGMLELLWIGTAKNCPRGDIGRFSNEEIAIMCDWEGDADLLVDALLETGWVDPCENHRLVIHDWAEHAPKWVRGNVIRHEGGFAKVKQGSSLGEPPKGSSLGELPKDSKEAPKGTSPKDTPPSQAKPNQAKPNQVKSSQEEEGAPEKPKDDWVIPDGWDSSRLRQALGEFVQMRKDIRAPIKSLARTSRVFERFDSAEHLLYAVEFCVANEYQGLKPEYRPSLTEKPKSRVASIEDMHNWNPYAAESAR